MGWARLFTLPGFGGSMPPQPPIIINQPPPIPQIGSGEGAEAAQFAGDAVTRAAEARTSRTASVVTRRGDLPEEPAKIRRPTAGPGEVLLGEEEEKERLG